MTGGRLRGVPAAGWRASRPGRCRTATLRPTSLRPPSFFLLPHLRRRRFCRNFIQAEPRGPPRSPRTLSADGRAPAPSLPAAADPGDPRPAPHLFLALAAETQARGPLLVAVAVIGPALPPPSQLPSPLPPRPPPPLPLPPPTTTAPPSWARCVSGVRPRGPAGRPRARSAGCVRESRPPCPRGVTSVSRGPSDSSRPLRQERRVGFGGERAEEKGMREPGCSAPLSNGLGGDTATQPCGFARGNAGTFPRSYRGSAAGDDPRSGRRGLGRACPSGRVWGEGLEEKVGCN